ncbi:MAG: response regulator [Candidatus Thermochlorobacter sp.]
MILLVEDDDIVRETLAEYLAENYEVIVAKNGKEGCQLVEQFQDKIKVIITDCDMPEMNGIELLHWLHEKNIQVPRMIVTGKSLSENEYKKIREYDAYLLSKPVDVEVICNHVQRFF